jgi:hypothetical protein
LRLLEKSSALDQALFDFADRNLHFEVARMQASQLIGPVKNRLEPFDVGTPFHLLIKQLQFVQRIEAIGAHDAIVH